MGTLAHMIHRTLIEHVSVSCFQMIEERPSYDTTQFIADVGGSLGFLLGLSVLGLIGILEHVSMNEIFYN